MATKKKETDGELAEWCAAVPKRKRTLNNALAWLMLQQVSLASAIAELRRVAARKSAPSRAKKAKRVTLVA
jgi:hypothetical protein